MNEQTNKRTNEKLDVKITNFDDYFNTISVFQ